MRSLRLPVSGLVFMMVLGGLVACRKEMVSDNEEQEKSKACRDIKAKAEAEQLALVQPPALSRVELSGGGFSELPLPKDAHLVLGLNLAAFQKSGLLDETARLVPPWFLAQNALTFLGLSPGKAVQAVVVGVTMDPKAWVPKHAVAALTGNFNATESVDHVHNIAGRLPNLELPPFSREGSDLVVSSWGHQLRLRPHGQRVLLITNSKAADTGFQADSELARLLSPIPRDTALWFACNRVTRELPGLPKVIANQISRLEQFSGYFNIDAQQNVEFQVRLRFTNEEAARQAKEIMRLGLSQGLLALGPRIQKSFSMDGSTDHESVVSRGRFVRILFRLDRFQTQYLMQWAVSTLKETGHWIFDRDSAMNASSGPVVQP